MSQLKKCRHVTHWLEFAGYWIFLVIEFEKGLLDFMEANYRELLDEIKMVGEMSDKTEKKMKKAIEDFKKGFSAS